MNIITQDVDSVSVVRIEGNLDTNTSPDAQQHLDELLAKGANKILRKASAYFAQAELDRRPRR